MEHDHSDDEQPPTPVTPAPIDEAPSTTGLAVGGNPTDDDHPADPAGRPGGDPGEGEAG